MQGEGEHGADLVARGGDVLAEQVDAGPDEAAEQQPQRDERRREGGRLGEQHVDRRLAVGPVRLRGDVVGATAVGGRLAVVDDGVGGDHDALAHAVGAPAEVQVVAEERQRRVEAGEGLPDVAADEHPRRAHREHVADAVVLALVVLASLEPGDATAGAGDRDAGLEEQAAVVPAEDLGTEDGHARVVVGGLEQPLEAVRVRGAVVVQEPHPGDGVGRERLVRAGAEVVEPGADRLAEADGVVEAEGALGTERAVRSRSGLASTDPVSTPTAASGSRVWAASVVSTAGSHTAPSWLTTTAVTWCSRRGRAGTSSSRAR